MGLVCNDMGSKRAMISLMIFQAKLFHAMEPKICHHTAMGRSNYPRFAHFQKHIWNQWVTAVKFPDFDKASKKYIYKSMGYKKWANRG